MDGQTVTGRAAVLIRWLAEHQRRVNGPDKGKLEIDFSGPKFTKRITEVLD